MAFKVFVLAILVSTALAGVIPLEYVEETLDHYPHDQPALTYSTAAHAPVGHAPTVDAAVAHAPVAHAPVTQSPIVHGPVAHAPVDHGPEANTPAAYAPVEHAPETQFPVAYVPIKYAPVAQAHVAYTPVAHAPVAYAPVANAPVAHAPIVHTPVVHAAVAVTTPVLIKTVVAEPKAPAHYDFGYSVIDPHTGDAKIQQETRRGDSVHGSYSFIDADGTKRTVEYTADDKHGFNAIVRKEPVTSKDAVPVVAASSIAAHVGVAPAAAKVTSTYTETVVATPEAISAHAPGVNTYAPVPVDTLAHTHAHGLSAYHH